MTGGQTGARGAAGSLAGGLAGNSILVTGASQGIGKAVCLELAGRGARLTLAARDAAALEQVAAACRDRGGEALVVPTDVSQPGDCERLVRQAVATWGALDALINNAGIDMIARFDEVADLQLFERLMRVNYLGYVYPTYYALPELRRSRGRLVAVSSLAGMTGVPTRTGYAASKHAIFGFFDSLRIELAGTGVTVTLVAPDFVLSEIHRRAAGPDGRPLGHSPMQESTIHDRRAVRPSHRQGDAEAPAPPHPLAEGQAGALRAAGGPGLDRRDRGAGGAAGEVEEQD
jgi:NAD(P)-dependent dehydrogenase (short-subunit alcohol dehydrogenase family)